MLRFLVKWLAGLCLLTLMLGLLGLGGAALTSQYLFQEPAYTTFSRYLMPEFRWQRQKYPSVRWLFDLVEPLIAHDDPRDSFSAPRPVGSLDGPAAWNSPIVGPRPPTSAAPLRAPGDTIPVTTARELAAAVGAATPGTTIELQPGLYDFSGRNISIGKAGQPNRRIVLRASTLGSARLRFNLLEGLHVLAPYWTFENLVIEGVCGNDSRCEHAFHVVGAGTNVIIRNNWITDFNATVKVNGKNGLFPDNGLIEHNIFFNNRPRNTGNPVTVLDIVAASHWRVRKNVIADFAKTGSDRISYGAFFKGAGEDNVFEQNLVRCEWRHSGGTRIGFSFGGGGTSKRACRDGRCDVEHRGGIARNNIIMNCPNDVAIYLNKSADTLLQNNALVNTRGIDVRFPESYSRVVNSIIDGRILARDGGRFTASHSILSPLQALFLGRVSADIYAAPERGDFRLKDPEEILHRGIPLRDAGPYLCGRLQGTAKPDIGPIQYSSEPPPCEPVIE